MGRQWGYGHIYNTLIIKKKKKEKTNYDFLRIIPGQWIKYVKIEIWRFDLFKTKTMKSL